MNKLGRTNAKLTGNRCQCPACFEYFSTTSNFDKHRKGKHGKDRHCVNPESVGLVIVETGGGTFWRMPGVERDFWGIGK
jgi:hypothetical protein